MRVPFSVEMNEYESLPLQNTLHQLEMKRRFVLGFMSEMEEVMENR